MLGKRPRHCQEEAMLVFRGYKPHVLFQFKKTFNDFNRQHSDRDSITKAVDMAVNVDRQNRVFCGIISYDVSAMKDWLARQTDTTGEPDFELRAYFNGLKAQMRKYGFECAYFDVPLLEGEQVDIL